MKIGEFAKLCSTGKDTIRYYVNLGLLIPKKQGAQLNFTKREYDDFHDISRLKKMQFNLKEIEAFFYLRRMSNMIEPDTIGACIELLTKKKIALQEEMRSITHSTKEIDKEIEHYLLQKNIQKTNQTGVPLIMLQFLCCPVCGKQLAITDAEIQHDYVYNGNLSCSCGYHATITNGIVTTGNVYTGGHDWPDVNRKLYKEIDEEWAVSTQKCADIIMEKIENHFSPNYVILEANINGFFYTYNYINQMPKNAYYIIVDKYAEVLSSYKDLIEQLHPEMHFLYIADASINPPIKPQSVDLLLSFYGESEHAFYHKELEISSFRKLFKNNLYTVGSFISYDKNAQSRHNMISKYPEGSSRMANINYLQEDYKKSNFSINTMRVGSVSKTKKHHSFECHVDGEIMEIYFYEATSHLK